MMNSANLSGLIGTKYLTVMVDYGSKISPTDSVYGVRGYSFQADLGHAQQSAADVLIRNVTAGYPAFILFTDKFFFGDLDHDFMED